MSTSGDARLSCCLRVAPVAFEHWAGKAGKTAEDLAETIQVPAMRSPGWRCWPKPSGCVVHSAHDDPDSQTQARFRMIGASVAEFPVSGGSIPLIRALVKRLPELKRGYDPTDVLLALSPDLAAMERHLARVLRAAVRPDMVYLAVGAGGISVGAGHGGAGPCRGDSG